MSIYPEYSAWHHLFAYRGLLVVKDLYVNETNRVAMIYISVKKGHSAIFDPIPMYISISHGNLAVFGTNLWYRENGGVL